MSRRLKTSNKIVIQPSNYRRFLQKEYIHQQIELLTLKFHSSCKQEHVEQIFSSIRRMKQLKGIHIDLGNYQERLQVSTITKLLLGLRHISKVFLEMYCLCEDKKAFQSFAKGLRNLNPYLTRLSIHTYLDSADVKSIQVIWKTLKRYASLETLEWRISLVPSRVDEGFKQMKSTLRTLKHLSSFTFEASSKDLKVSQYIGSALEELSRLKYLNFTFPGQLTSPCDQITKFFGGLLKRSNVENLGINLHQKNLSLNDFHKHFCENLQKLNQLTHLKLSLGFSPFLTTEGLQVLGNSIRRLFCLSYLELQLFREKELDSEELAKVTSILKDLPQLKTFHFLHRHSVKRKPPIDYSGLFQVIQEMKNLQESCLKLQNRKVVLKRIGNISPNL